MGDVSLLACPAGMHVPLFLLHVCVCVCVCVRFLCMQIFEIACASDVYNRTYLSTNPTCVRAGSPLPPPPFVVLPPNSRASGDGPEVEGNQVCGGRRDAEVMPGGQGVALQAGVEKTGIHDATPLLLVITHLCHTHTHTHHTHITHTHTHTHTCMHTRVVSQ